MWQILAWRVLHAGTTLGFVSGYWLSRSSNYSNEQNNSLSAGNLHSRAVRQAINYRTNKLHRLCDGRCYGETRSRGGRWGLLKGNCSVNWSGEMAPRRLGGDLQVTQESLPTSNMHLLVALGPQPHNSQWDEGWTFFLEATFSSTSSFLRHQKHTLPFPSFSKNSVSLVYPLIHT